MRSNSAGQNPCGPLAPPPDRDRRPCEGSSEASATRPAVRARAAPRSHQKWFRGAEARLASCEPAGEAWANVCAMIPASAAERVPQPATRYFSGGRAPMLVIRRLNLSRRALLWLLVVLAVPLAAPAATLEESARELARKIAGNLPAQEKVLIEIRNTSSLSPIQVAQVETALKGELPNYVVLAATEGEASARVAVTLSENIKDLVWAAEIRQGDAFRVVVLTTARPSENQGVSGAMRVELHAEKFWEGPVRLRDASLFSDDNGENLLALLFADRVMIQKVGSEIVFKVEIPIDQTVSRDPAGGPVQLGGGLAHLGNTLIVQIEWQICTIALDTRTVAECRSIREPPPGHVPDKIVYGSEISIPPGKGGQIATIRSECSGTDLFLLTGPRDYTEPDTVQAFQGRTGGATAVSAELNLPGPVMSLHSDAPRAIVRNLKSGNYEAYRLSITCGQ
jgi:hypothetical protein